MILLILFAFLAGVVTILSPCILPILPIILTSSVPGSDSKRSISRPYGIVTGFILSFTFFTLFLSQLVSFSGLDANILRNVSVVIIAIFGFSYLMPGFQQLIERLFSRISNLVPRSSENNQGFLGGVAIGFSIGLLWTPCVGPILASVISLAITGTVTFDTFFITLSYAIGTAIPMFLIIMGGQNALKKVPWLLRNTENIQKVFGLVMIVMAIAIYFNLDRTFQTYILNKFPNYGTGLTSVEDNELVNKQLSQLNGIEIKEDDMGKPSYELIEPKGVKAPEIITGGEWFNSEPLKLSELRGKVVIIDFWTYTCINCQRTFPYLRDWYSKYKDQGLVIIGVHSPEFEFEKDPDNVSQAIADFQLEYPIVQDNDFLTWRAYNNRYWPSKYFIDKDGYVRYTHFGEGAYDESEQVIQELLKEAGATDINEEVNNPTYNNYARTPETYLGYQRIAGFASLESIKPDQTSNYSFPSVIPKNGVAYEGSWEVASEYAKPSAGSLLKLDFEAREVFLVMRTVDGELRSVKVYLDGVLDSSGDDSVSGVVNVTKDDLYKIIKLPTSGRQELILEFPEDGVELYAFTFG